MHKNFSQTTVVNEVGEVLEELRVCIYYMLTRREPMQSQMSLKS